MDGPEVVEASAEKLAELQRLTAEVAELERRIAAKAPARPRPWHTQARPEQIPPPGSWDVALVLAGRGFGKALSLDVLIPTPGGWSEMGKLLVGDQVFDETGKLCNVTAVHDIWAEEAYRLTFSGGATLDACADHRWVTWTHADRKAFLRSPYEDTRRMPADWPTWRLKRRCKGDLQPRVYSDSPGPQVRTTREVVATLATGKRGDTNHSIPLAGTLELPAVALPIDPYVLGMWLGDGHSAGATVTIGAQDAAETIGLLRKCGESVAVTRDPIIYSVGARTPMRDATTGRMVANGGLHARLAGLDLLHNKHVPPVYLRASAEQRLALLQGLMDSDGFAGTNSFVEFCSTKRVLADAVHELACSLGQKPVLGEGRATIDGRDCGPKYRVTWRPTIDVFRLQRKRDRIVPPAGQAFRLTHRMIVSADRIPAQPMRCITVDSPNHMYLAGEHMIPTHNTRAGAEWIIEQAARNPDTEWAVIAPTWRDCQKTCFEGPSGLVKSLLPGEFESMNMSGLQLRLTNGSRIYGYSADRPDRLRGSNLAGAWIDELAACQHAEDLLGEALMPALRIGEHPRVLITTTPRPVKVIKELVARTDGSVVVIRGSTWDNAANLSKTALASLRARYEGTRMGRQELEAEILEDVEGALWTRDRLDASRVDAAPHMVRIVVGVDPAVTSGEKSDFTGIVVAGKSADGDLYILEDLTMKGSPHACMVAAVNAYKKWEADRIVGEVNNGGDYLEGLLRTVDPSVSYKSVRATRGKTVRAEPIASLWEQGRGHIVGVMPALEDEMCSFSLDGSTGDHDDRVDACFVAGTPVLLERGEVPIEQVVPGDLAWTRAGWKPVLRSELTRRDAAVMTVELSNGHRLTGTSNHRVWANNAWSDLNSLVWGDILDGWTSLPCPSFSTASDTPETLTRNNAATGSITSRQADTNASTYTAQSGGRLTRGEQFPRGGTSTTSTMIRSTTPPPTSRPSALSTTAPAMPGSAVTPSARTSNGSGPLPLHGTAARRESSGTASTASARGTTGSTGPSRVNAAASGIRLGKPESTHGSAPEPAATVSTTSRTDIRCGFPAPSAGRSSGNPSTGQSPSRVATSVVRRFVEPERRDVYDLMVADQHEFVAAGVIVHNCTWAATELSVGASAMVYLSAISRVCNRCEMPNRRTDLACRGCGEQLPAVA